MRYGGGGMGPGISGGGSAPNFMDYTGGLGSNQYQNLPPWLNTGSMFGGSSRPASYASGLGVPGSAPAGTQSFGPGWTGAGGGPILGGGDFSVEQTMDPQLTQGLFNYLQSQVGKGVTPFNLPTQLPFGGTTAPGQLTAMANPLLQQLMKFYQTGQGGPAGAQTLENIATQGINAVPAWQQMVAAQQQGNAQLMANLREQYGAMGGLAGSPAAQGLANATEQIAQQQNAQLAQMQLQGILQGQLPAAEELLSGGQQFGGYAQALNQQAIQNMQNEFIRTQSQYNPLLALMYGGATSFNPVLNRSGMTGGGALSGLFSGLASNAPAIIKALETAGAASAG